MSPVSIALSRWVTSRLPMTLCAQTCRRTTKRDAGLGRRLIVNPAYRHPASAIVTPIKALLETGSSGLAPALPKKRFISGRPSPSTTPMRTRITIIVVTFVAACLSRPVVADVSTIVLPAKPAALIAFPALHRIYVASGDASSISVINPSSDTLEGPPVSVRPNPRSLAIDPVWGTLIAPSFTGNTVDLMDAATKTVWGVIPSVGSAPNAVAMDSAAQRLYVALHDGSAVRVVDVGSIPFDFLETVDLPAPPTDIAVNGTAHLIHVATEDGRLVTIDGATNKAFTPISVGSRTVHLIVSASEEKSLAGKVYITTESGLAVVSQSGLLEKTIPIPGAPSAVAMNPATGSIFVTNVADNTVTVIDGHTNMVIAVIKVGREPIAMDVMTSSGALAAGEHKVYVANAADQSVSVFMDPAAGRDLITVPIRWCAIEGSPAANGVTVAAGQAFAPGNSSTDDILLGLLRGATARVWIRGAHIAFRAANVEHFPIIPDPRAPGVSGDGQLGDIGLSNLGHELTEVTQGCAAAWAELAPNERGIIAVNVRAYVSDSSLGITTTASITQRSDPRIQDLCVAPRHLLTSDVTASQVTVIDPKNYGPKTLDGLPMSNGESASTSLAHELGHALLLGHGDGVDNDKNGVLPPLDGPRLYDTICDPAVIVDNDGNVIAVEDSLLDQRNGCGSIMLGGTGSCGLVQPLQVEAARDAAKLIPGASFVDAMDPAATLVSPKPCRPPSCDVPSDLVIDQMEIAQTPRTGTTELTFTLDGTVLASAANDYTALLDVDANPSTGCRANAIMGSTVRGMDLAVRIHLGANKVPEAQVFRCAGQRFRSVAVASLPISVGNSVASDGKSISRGRVTLVLPREVGVPPLRAVRLEAGAMRAGNSIPAYRLVAPNRNARLILTPPILPSCNVTPSVAQLGEPVTVDADGLPANQSVSIFVGETVAGTAMTSASGHVHASFPLNAMSAPFTQISLVSAGTARTATCAVALSGGQRGRAELVSQLQLVSRVRSTVAVVRRGAPVTFEVAAINGPPDMSGLGVDVQFDPVVLRFDSATVPSVRLSRRSLRLIPRRRALSNNVSTVQATFTVIGCPGNNSTVITARGSGRLDRGHDSLSQTGRTLMVLCK